MSTMPTREFDATRLSDDLVRWLADGNEPDHGWMVYLRMLAREARDARVAAVNLKPLDAERVREVVRDAFCYVDCLAGHPDAPRIAARITAQLTGAVAGLTVEERAGLKAIRAVLDEDWNLQVKPRPGESGEWANIRRGIALLDRLLLATAFDSAARTITGQSAAARLDAQHPSPSIGSVAARSMDANIERSFDTPSTPATVDIVPTETIGDWEPAR